jgi:hypothetical protein
MTTEAAGSLRLFLRLLPGHALFTLSYLLNPNRAGLQQQNGQPQNAGAVRLCGMAAAVAMGRRAAALHSLPTGGGGGEGQGGAHLGGGEEFSFVADGFRPAHADETAAQGDTGFFSKGGAGPSPAAAALGGDASREGGRGSAQASGAGGGDGTMGGESGAGGQGTKGDWEHSDGWCGGGVALSGGVDGSSSVGSMAGLLAACLASSLVPSAPASLVASLLAGLACRVALVHALRLRLAATAATLYTVAVAGSLGGMAGMMLAPSLDAATQAYLWVLGMPAEGWRAGGGQAAAAAAVGAAAGLMVKLASVCAAFLFAAHAPACTRSPQ